MKTYAFNTGYGWRILLLAILPTLAHCSRIDGSVGLSNQDGDAYSFEGASVKVFPLDHDVIIPGQNVPIGLGRVETADGTIALQVITAAVDDDALYDVEIRCPSNNAADACNVETPLHVVLGGQQLMAGGWQATAMTEAAYQNITYYAAVKYPVPDIVQMLDSNADALLNAPPQDPADYTDLLAWRPALTENARRPELLANLSEQLAAGIGNNDLKLLTRKFISPPPAGITPAAVQSASLLFKNAGDLAAAGPHGYMSRRGSYFIHVYVLDLTNPLAPALLPFELEYNIGAITVGGDYLYLNDDQFGKVRIADVSNPLQPVLLPVEIAPDPDEFFGVLSFALGDNLGVLPWGNSDGEVDRDGVRHGEMGCTNPTGGSVGGLFGVDISIPASASIISHICMPEEARAAAMGDTHAYAAVVGNLFQVVDYSNPAQPVMAGQTTLSAMANTLTLIGHYVWASVGAAGIDIVDVADPAVPTVITNFDTAGYTREIFVHHNYAYVTDGVAGLLVFDVTDPGEPVLLATMDTRDNVGELFVSGDYLYAGTSEGIEIFRKMPASL